MSVFTMYNPATGIVFEDEFNFGDTSGGGGASSTAYQGLSITQLLSMYDAGRITANDVATELRSRTNSQGVRLYSDAAISEVIQQQRDSQQAQAGKTAVATDPRTAKPGDLMKDMIAKEASAAAAPVPNAQAYSDATEQWRPLVSKYFKPEDVDKALYVIEHESGGDPNAQNKSGASGLFQIMPMHGLGEGAFNPETAVKWAANQVYNVRHGWQDWGEGVTYNGEKFGALGLGNYGGLPGASKSGSGSGSSNGGGQWNTDDIKSSIQNFNAWQQPKADQIAFKSATGTPGDFPGIWSALADLYQTYRQEGLNADSLNGTAGLRGSRTLPTSDYWDKNLGGAAAASPVTSTPAPAPQSAYTPEVKAAITELMKRPLGFAQGGSVGPAGRTYEQATGQDYLSEAERAWYLQELMNRGGNPDAAARQWLADYLARQQSTAPVESRAPAQQPAVGNTAVVRPLTPQEQQRINAQNTQTTAVAAANAANGTPQAASSRTSNVSTQPKGNNPGSWMYEGASLDDGLRSSITNFNDWQRPRFQQLQFGARTGKPSDFPGLRVALADLAQNYRQEGLDVRDRLSGIGEFAGNQPLPSSDYYRKIGFAGGGSATVESYGNSNGFTPRGQSPASTETNRPNNLDQLYGQAVQRYVGPNETDVNLMAKSARFGGFQNLSNILRNLNSMGRDFQGQDLSAGYRVPGFNSLQDEIYQRIFKTPTPANVYFAGGGSAGPDVGMNPDGTPHLTLDGPATLIDNATGTPLANAGEIGLKENVTPMPGGGLDFQPTPQLQSGFAAALGPETRKAVSSAIVQLLSGRNKTARRGRHAPAPVGSTPAMTPRMTQMLGMA